jgi:hypothetical protein
LKKSENTDNKLIEWYWGRGNTIDNIGEIVVLFLGVGLNFERYFVAFGLLIVGNGILI